MQGLGGFFTMCISWRSDSANTGLAELQDTSVVEESCTVHTRPVLDGVRVQPGGRDTRGERRAGCATGRNRRCHPEEAAQLSQSGGSIHRIKTEDAELDSLATANSGLL